MRIYISKKLGCYNEIKYVLFELISRYTSTKFVYSENSEQADLVWDQSSAISQPLALDFYHKIGEQNNRILLMNEPLIRTNTGIIDRIATIFYLVNAIQELNCTDSEEDSFGRFKYEASLQFRFDVVLKNLVSQHISDWLNEQKLKHVERRSSFFVSHDIDLMYDSKRQDAFYVVKKGRPATLLKLLFFELLKRPHWRNIDVMLKLNSEHDVKSTYFWLVEHGKGLHGIKNADYKIQNEKKLLAMVYEANSENGLHKASGSLGFDAELERINPHVPANRYHFLKFKTHAAWQEIERSSIKLDASLGFAEHYGFRNSFGDAFRPYNFETGVAHSFVSVPLTFMDTTFRNYMKVPADTVADIIIAFYERNSTNCTHGLLWHNNFITEYKFGDYLKAYKKLLSYIYDSKIETKLSSEIIEERLNDKYL
jgi:hypothetical protein